MRLNLHHVHVRSSDELNSLLENRILDLQPRLPIDEANVRLECRFEESPAFGVQVHLVTPGPGVIAEGHDHTLRAAIVKVLADLETKIHGRSLKRGRRLRGNRQSPAALRLRRAALTAPGCFAKIRP